MILNYLNAGSEENKDNGEELRGIAPQEWAGDLLDMWLRHLKEEVEERKSARRQTESRDAQDSSSDSTAAVSPNQRTSPINILKLFQQILKKEAQNSNFTQFSVEWQKKLLEFIMLEWHAWNRCEKDFIFANIFNSALENNICSESLLQWLWSRSKAYSGMFGDSTLTKVMPNKTYQILCQFFDYFFSPKKNSSGLDLRFEDDFWRLLIEGLKKTHSFILKRCEYLLKRIIEIAKEDTQHIQYTEFFVFNSSTPQEKQEDDKLWDTWFMLWDNILSHSTHLVQPVWGEVFRLFPRKASAQQAVPAQKKSSNNILSTQVKRSIHPIWLQVLFHHGLNHDNFGIQKIVLASLYSFDYSTFVLPFPTDYILEVIFKHGDQIKLYQDKYSIGHRMIQFMKGYAEQLQHDSVATLIEKIIRKMSLAFGGAEGGSRSTITFAGFSYFIKLILLIDRSLFDNQNLLSVQLVQSLEQVFNASCTINGGWIVIRQSALLCELLVHLGALTRENVTAVSHLLARISDKVMAVPALERRLREHFDDDILLDHINQLLTEYFDNSMLESFNDAKRLKHHAHRVARMCRLATDSSSAVNLVAQHTESILEGIYSRSYLSTTQKFKALTVVNAVLREVHLGEDHKKVPRNDASRSTSSLFAASQIIQSLILPNLNEILSFAGTHLTFPDFSTTGFTRAHLKETLQQSAVYRESNSGVFCDRAIFDLFEFLLLHSTVENAQLIKFIDERVVKSSCTFVENLVQVFGGSLVVRNVDTVQALTCNLLLLRALGGLSVLARFVDSENTSSHFSKPLLSRAFDATRRVLLITTSKDAFAIDEQHFLEKHFSSSQMTTKLCRCKWDTLFHWLNFFHRHEGTNLIASNDDSILQIIDEALDALDLINSRATAIPLACVALALNLIEHESSLDADTLRNIVKTAESAASGTSHGTELECYFALVKILLGHKYALHNKTHIEEVLIPALQSLLKKSVLMSRLIVPVAFQVAQVLVNPSIDAQQKSLLGPIILHMLSIENEDTGIQGQSAVERVHTDFITSPVDTELSALYPPAIHFDEQVGALLYLAMYNLPSGSDIFVSAFVKHTLTEGAAMDVPRFAPNSVDHLSMIRKWKLLLVMTPHFTEKVCRENYDLIWGLVAWDRPNSVRRLIEFFLVILFSKFPFMEEKLEKDCSEINAPAGISISRMILMGSLISFGPEEVFVSRGPNVLPLALAYCNATHHNIRTIAQTMLCAMLHRREKILKQGRISVEDFPLSEDVLKVQQFIESSESCMKWIEKYHPVFLFDPYVSAEPEKLLLNHLETHDKTPVFDRVPLSVFRAVREHAEALCASVCNVIDRDTSRMAFYIEDWKVEDYVQSLMKNYQPQENDYRDFADDMIGIYETLPKPVFHKDNDNDESTATQVINFQRKIVPWQEMDVNNELNPRLGRDEGLHSLIVCATFVDRIPNLAGLTRTSEIFAAEKLVMANKSVTRMDMFKNISVTAENWMPIEEVAEENLMQYLLDKKAEGYSIVGLEQTADSIGIDEFAFPKKCLVLLGKEREGIPTEYLQLLDACVEIEQFGLIRSLNVHVSASVLMYEYTKQHYMRGAMQAKAQDSGK
eukprot:CAMPEP_0117454716 /NCGR_PEP_ID=MMETSP0759-20121206/10960_1 /TAXON_ID=63605 /ORGANISM="Percolomonas cosmopolitus, Strain WS" /LENGTH=1593 /DNA_ID=CAMNT_0005247943 /DNA_START=402 /DNA_END=5183 /DNA_ORIENTATION=+